MTTEAVLLTLWCYPTVHWPALALHRDLPSLPKASPSKTPSSFSQHLLLIHRFQPSCPGQSSPMVSLTPFAHRLTSGIQFPTQISAFLCLPSLSLVSVVTHICFPSFLLLVFYQLYFHSASEAIPGSRF